MNSYSQLKQDIEVIEFYNYKKNGYFIEIGANDGIEFSNTYLLEKDYDWKGICVEPLPDVFNKLKINRPNSICINKAVFNQSNKILNFTISNSHSLLSGLTDYIVHHKNTVFKDYQNIEVESITLNDILNDANAPNFIEYMSLDTEGTELEILKSVDHNKYKFGIIHVEHNYVEPIRSQIRELLESNNYLYVRECYFDDVYQLKDL
jgi:FkbM family methyltransferase